MTDQPRKIDQFLEVVNRVTGRFHIIITQVDPDALGSARAIMSILNYLHKTNDCYYCGQFAHPQNRAIISRLNFKSFLKPIAELENNIKENDVFILVDSSSTDDNRLGAWKDKIKPIIVIDHHRDGNITEAAGMFVWIEDVGACSTLVFELLHEFFKDKDMDISNFALALALGIYTDTRSLTSSSARDRDAYTKLSNHFKPEDLQEIISYPLSKNYFGNLLVALQTKKTIFSTTVCNLGYISEQEGDDISTVADYLSREEGITLVIAWAIVGAKVRISARNDNISTPLDDYLKERFGRLSGAKMTPDGRGEGGALIELNLGFWLELNTKDEVLALVAKKIDSLIFANGKK